MTILEAHEMTPLRETQKPTAQPAIPNHQAPTPTRPGAFFFTPRPPSPASRDQDSAPWTRAGLHASPDPRQRALPSGHRPV